MLKQGHIGVHPPGALGVALFMHAHADCFIGCANDGITKPLAQKGHLQLDDGQAVRQVPLAGRLFCNLLESDAHHATPELLLACCNPGQLKVLTAELTQYLASHAERGHLRTVEDIHQRVPIILVLPNGVVAEEMIETYRGQLAEAMLMDRLPGVTEQMIEAAIARIVRGVSMQAGGRRGTGTDAIYILENRGAVLVADPNHEPDSPGKRAAQILQAREYPAKLINRPALRVEFDKAIISIVLNVGGLIHMVAPQGDLIDLRMGDLCLDESKADFVDQVTRAVYDVGTAAGAYGDHETYDEVWAGHRATILAHARHVTSSVKAFRDALAAGLKSVSLMTNEEWILTPLQRYAARAGMNAERDLFRSLAQQVQEAMARAIKRGQKSDVKGQTSEVGNPGSTVQGPKSMNLTAQRNISIELFECDDEDLLLTGTMLDTEHLIKLEMMIHLADEQITRSRLDMIRTPFPVCRQVQDAAEHLVGLRIQRGVLNEIAKRVGGRIGCSHLKELATNIVYFAASYLARRRAGLNVVGFDSAHIPTEEKFRLTRTFLNGSCLAYCQTSPLELDERRGIRRVGPVHESPVSLGEYEPSLGVVLRERAARFGDRPYLRHRAKAEVSGHKSVVSAVNPNVKPNLNLTHNPKRFELGSGEDAAVTHSYSDFARQVFQISRHLIARDIRKGDRIAMISENRAEMFMFELAAMAIGAVSVPIYAGYPGASISYVLRHARPRLAVVSGTHQLNKIERERHSWIEAWYCMDFDDAANAWGAVDFASLTIPDGAGKAAALSDELDSFIEAVRPDDLCMVMYTSGTTGPPKGVKLSHRNLISQQKALSLLWDVTERDVFLSYLPWHHSFGGLFERFMTLYNGCELCLDDSFGRDVNRLLENWRVFNPTLFFSVPRVHDLLLARCRQDDIAANTVFGGRLRFVFTAGASLPAHVASHYSQHNIPVLEGWGLTETSPCCTVTNQEAGWRSGYVGLPIPGVSIRIDSDQEILVRGPNVMQGYLNDEDMTARVIDEEGWFHTGDLGEFVTPGAGGGMAGLRIIGRRDGAFKLTTGEKVHPHRIETTLVNESNYIATALALGSGRDFVGALIFPDRARLREWAQRNGIEGKSLLEHPDVRELFAAEIERINPMIEVKYQRIKRAVLVDRDLSLERGELTPSGKICRTRVCDGCKREIEMLFAEEPGGSVIVIEQPQQQRTVATAAVGAYR